MKYHKSLITDDWQYCYAKLMGCTGKATHCHHLIGGYANRKKSDKALLVIPVCAQCHEKIHSNKDIMKRFKQLGQTAFEKQYSRDKFIKEFHKNYLED